jgi:hypothetical protein
VSQGAFQVFSINGAADGDRAASTGVTLMRGPGRDIGHIADRSV